MALNWIKWVKGLSRRREVLAIAQALGLERRVVACACMELWEWADDNTATGHVPGLTVSEIDDVVRLTGFACALAAAGWLIVKHDGIQFPRWDRHNSESAKKRALAAERQARKRKKDATVMSRSSRNKDATREEKRRGDKRWRWVLRKLDVMEIKQPRRLFARYTSLVHEGYVQDCEARRHEFFGFVAKSLADGTDPAAMLYALLSEWNPSKITNGYADEANRMLKEALRG